MPRAAEPIVIVGMGLRFPGAPSPSAYWDHLVSGADASREVPDGRWLLPEETVTGGAPGEPDRVPAARGYFLDPLALDLHGLDLDAAAVAALDPVFHLTLLAGRDAFHSCAHAPLDRARVGITIGNIVLPTAQSSKLAQELLGGTFAERVTGKPSPAPSVRPADAFPAALPAGLLARGLGLGGGSCALDAACASSLYALKLAADALRDGRADAMLAGGVSRPDCFYTQMGFAQLRALSPSGRCHPFDERAAGLVVGEGAGLFVLKRLGDALAHGDRILGVLAGCGLSNDGNGGLMAPSSEGQLRAMRAAYAQADWRPWDVDAIECHATGTPLGDQVEVTSLTELWREAPNGARARLGSVKGAIGHLLTAAGASSLAKTLLALEHGTIPPTAGFARAADRLGLGATPFEVPAAPVEWPRRAPGRPRRAAVSGFGFGGINAHVLVEEFDPAVHAPVRPAVAVPVPAPRRVAVVGLHVVTAEDPDLDSFAQRRFDPAAAAARPLPPPHAPWFGAEHAAWYQRLFRHGPAPAAQAVTDVSVPIGRFRIPPLEMKDMLPQQLLVLLAASRALEGVTVPAAARARWGVTVGLGLDGATNHYSGRWRLALDAARWRDELGLALDDDGVAAWTAELRTAFGPELTANRVMGSLAGVVASRIAREYQLGGASFTVSNEEASGVRALAFAARAIRAGELAGAVVGAVDLPAQLVQAVAMRLLARERHLAEPLELLDAAVALVLKDYDQAVADGDRILALVEDVELAGVSPSTAARTSASAARSTLTLDAASPAVHAGAATGLLAVAEGVLALDRKLRPNDRAPAVYWARDRADGPRRVVATCRALDGTQAKVVLAGADSSVEDRAAQVAGGPHASVSDPAARVTTHPSASAPDLAPPPLGPGHHRFGLFLLAADSREALVAAVASLAALADAHPNATPSALATKWYRATRTSFAAAPLRLALVHDGTTPLADQLARASRLARGDADPNATRHGLHLADGPARPGELGFLFPGAGSHYWHLGAELAAAFPEVPEAQDRRVARLGEQLAADRLWREPPEPLDDATAMAAQCAFACVATGVLARCGIRPSAALGYSLGESTALVALGAWPDRDGLYARLHESEIFTRELSGERRAVRRAWGLAPGEPVRWTTHLVRREPAAVRAALAGLDRVYLNNVNTAQECVVGGDRAQLAEVLRRLDHPPVEIPALPALHCAVVNEIAREFREFHDLPVTAPEGVRCYGGATGDVVAMTSEGVAESILRHAVDGVNFPRVIEQAYADGVRVFLEVGPGGALTRMTREILKGRPHRALSLCARAGEELRSVYHALAELAALGYPVDLAALYARAPEPRREKATLKVPAGARAFGEVALPPRKEREMESAHERSKSGYDPAKSAPDLSAPVARGPYGSAPDVAEQVARGPHESAPDPRAQVVGGLPPSPHAWQTTAALLASYAETQRQLMDAHAAHMRLSQDAFNAIGQLLLATPTSGDHVALPASAAEPTPAPAQPNAAGQPTPQRAMRPTRPALNPAPAWLDYAACHEYAAGSVGKVLGPAFAGADAFPTRVRLPDGPLLLCHRIMSVDAEPLSMSHGTLITEHDVLSDAWYLDDGRIPTCVAVEAGQADLFLSGYLGADFHTKGLSVYRLLDAAVTFHDRLPTPGSVLRYVIKIHHFFRQGETLLFRFGFEATADGRPLMTMENGVAGFFSREELAAGKGVVKTALQLAPRPGKLTGGFTAPVPMRAESYDDAQVDALRRGDYVTAFGDLFTPVTQKLAQPKRLPGDMLRLVHRIVSLDPAGGRYGLGKIVGEADIHPDDWFLTCHFVDDMVMPGTLMYECCMHTLRVFLMRLGWVGEEADVPCEPKPGVASRLKCRGQVLQTTKKVRYEIELKEVGYDPDAYALADALMIVDGKPSVEMTDMSIRHLGLTKAKVDALWEGAAPVVAAEPPLGAEAPAEPAPVFSKDQILAFSSGNPSEAFGAPYAPFDLGKRRIARLPQPPFQLIDRVTRVDAEPFVMRAGGTCEARYDVPRDAWYFDAAGATREMPLSVLVEAALQPCGWFSAYMGAALTSSEDLFYRNLGGKAVQHRPVTPDSGTLVTSVTATKVSQSGGMIVHEFRFSVEGRQGPVYEGETVFGFFTGDSLAKQVGLRGVAAPLLAAARAPGRPLPYPDRPELPRAPLLMLDEVTELDPKGGAHGLGRVLGKKRVDPAEWFFAAHFLGDPVMPGSLGLEAFQQLLMVLGAELWPGVPLRSPAPGLPHGWQYRGQVRPDAKVVEVLADVERLDPDSGTLVASGVLLVDGLPIYEMRSFSLGKGTAHADLGHDRILPSAHAPR